MTDAQGTKHRGKWEGGRLVSLVKFTTPECLVAVESAATTASEAWTISLELPEILRRSELAAIEAVVVHDLAIQKKGLKIDYVAFTLGQGAKESFNTVALEEDEEEHAADQTQSGMWVRNRETTQNAQPTVKSNGAALATSVSNAAPDKDGDGKSVLGFPAKRPEEIDEDKSDLAKEKTTLEVKRTPSNISCASFRSSKKDSPGRNNNKRGSVEEIQPARSTSIQSDASEKSNESKKKSRFWQRKKAEDKS
mmetsp:Transcript_34124/g.47305  ORF Transcript_34124/g.47305 Transcript_34124/m.47305 type:complete len:251 (-) Transcript_34124:128-880(-)|eukprot:CAMPEP_0196580332 /NCGR_PEP_ID=MMETSP1081-20130531/28563_1 /TAXON_ID=36882 /ORGANISM="Pyramimonas amylifera, Strain CCMP720" /LENGTH=250 /DNA_ID=CAMNT_0041900171 /DNA_START=1 /DNA_END=753 /DNA_ORIENTATION=+